MRLSARLMLTCMLLAAFAAISCAIFSVRYAWQDAVSREAEDMAQEIANIRQQLLFALEARPATHPASRNPQMIWLFQNLTDHRADFVLMHDGTYLVNNTGWDLHALVAQMKDFTVENVSWGAFELQGEKLLVLAAPLPNTEDTIFMTGSLAPLDDGIRALAYRCAAACILIICISCLASWGITRRILSPLGKLQEVAEEIAEGSYSRRINAPGKDEVSALADSFNNMAAAVENNVAQLEQRAENQRLLIGNMGHEIRTPVTSILLNAETMLIRDLPREQQIQCLERIRAQGKWLEQLSQNLLSLVLLDQSPEITALVCSDLASDLQAAFPEEKRLAISAEKGSLHAEPSLLLSAVANLVQNARRASRGEDRIEVHIAPDAITVRDHGCGMTSEQLQRACEPFYVGAPSRSKEHSGTGLGLALVRRICDAHDATLEISSTSGAGTSAIIRFRPKE